MGETANTPLLQPKLHVSRNTTKIVFRLDVAALLRCHQEIHFPDSDPSFHLHFWHRLTSWYKVRWIIIECIRGSRGVLLSGLNLMQSHLFNFTTQEHLQVYEGENKAPQRGRHCRGGWTGLILWPLASQIVSSKKRGLCRGDVRSECVIWVCDDKCWFILR